MRRAAKRVGREHHDEIDAEALPVERAQIGDRRGDVAAEHVDGDVVAELEAEAVGDLLLERDQRRAVVIRAPPFALDDARAGRHLVGIGDAAVALQHPGGVRRRLEVLGADAVGGDDAAAQHRHVLELGLGRALRGRRRRSARRRRPGCRGSRTTAPCPAAPRVNCWRRLPSISITVTSSARPRPSDSTTVGVSAPGRWMLAMREPQHGRARARQPARRAPSARWRPAAAARTPPAAAPTKISATRGHRRAATASAEQRGDRDRRGDVAPCAASARCGATSSRNSAATGTSWARPSGQSAKASAVSRP